MDLDVLDNALAVQDQSATTKKSKFAPRARAVWSLCLQICFFIGQRCTFCWTSITAFLTRLFFGQSCTSYRENAGLTPVVCFRGQPPSLLRHLGPLPCLETALRTVLQVNLTAQSVSVYGCSVSACSLHVGSFNRTSACCVTFAVLTCRLPTLPSITAGTLHELDELRRCGGTCRCAQAPGAGCRANASGSCSGACTKLCTKPCTKPCTGGLRHAVVSRGGR